MKTGVIGKNRRISLLVVLVVLFIVPSVPAAGNLSTDPLRVTNTKAWTTLFYLDGDYDSNNFDPLDSIFLNEINSSANVNVVVIQDLEEAPAFLYYIDENHTPITLKILDEINMGDPQTLSDFISYGKSQFPADRYLLYVYDHGGGWKGACMDETDGGLISMDGFQNALTEAGGVDIIVFFACLMASLETVYELRDCTDVVVGSEDLAYISWWDGVCGDTNQLLTSLPNISTEELGKNIVNFFPEHKNPYSSRLTMSAIRTEKITALVDALNQLAQHQTSRWLLHYRSIRIAHDRTFLLADYQSWAPVFEVYDLKGYLDNLPRSLERTAVLDAFNAVVITEVHGSTKEGTYGLSVFFPARNTASQLLQLYEDHSYGLDFAADTSWTTFLSYFIRTNTFLRK